VIIEDEKLTAADLKDAIQKVEPSAEVVAIVPSVKEGIAYFSKAETPDLIFSDIQLGDGLSFEIFKAVPVSSPVIFCTAYNEYALNAFKANGIDYILKPFRKETISDALAKYKALQKSFANSTRRYEAVSMELEKRMHSVDAALLVYIKDKIVPVKISDIALFYIENEITRLITFNQKTYSINKTLEELQALTGNSFYRANRQCLVNRKAVQEAAQSFSRKLVLNLSIPFSERITVSKEKAPEFLSWLAGS
jgi:two-component system, LytTR family, response regulator LytT